VELDLVLGRRRAHWVAGPLGSLLYVGSFAGLVGVGLIFRLLFRI
jgi:hypothetical protein